jgi:hypothetical protein
VRVANKLLGVPDYWWGECPATGWWWRESKKSNTKPPGMYENGRFPALLDKKSPKTLFFTSKYLTKYTSKTFFEEYIY